MTIIVFAELGGDSLLGKARELGDAWGDKVVAFTSQSSETQQQKLIYLGADEVISCNVGTLGDWITVICDYVESEGNSKMIIFPSKIPSNSLMGMICARGRGRFSPFVDGGEMLESDSVAKKFGTSKFAVRKKLAPEKVMLASLRVSSFSPAYEDSSRYGKIRTMKPVRSSEDFQIFSSRANIVESSSEELTILVGGQASEKTEKLAEKLAQKYRGRAKKYSSKIEAVYGPCLAIEVSSKLRELPEFKGELISIARAALPINSIADSSIVTSEIDEVLQGLLSN